VVRDAFDGRLGAIPAGVGCDGLVGLERNLNATC